MCWGLVAVTGRDKGDKEKGEFTFLKLPVLSDEDPLGNSINLN